MRGNTGILSQYARRRGNGYKDLPDTNMHPTGADNKIMHASFRIGETTILASDGNCQGEPNFTGFSLSLNVSDESEAERLFTVLAEARRVQVPLTKVAFSPRFGMVADRLGVSWMISVATQGQRP